MRGLRGGSGWGAAGVVLLGLLLLFWLGLPSAVASSLAEGGASVPSLERVLARPGTALHAAVAAMNDGERLLAEALLSATAERHPVIADHADLLRMRLRVEGGRHDEAIAMRDGWTHGSSPVSAEFYTLLGRAYAAKGDEVRARSSWEYAATDRDHRVDLTISIAESYQRSGKTRRAAESFLSVWTRHPISDGAETAEASLDQIERQLGRKVRTASDHRRRADALYGRRRNEEALAAYEHALGLGLSGEEEAKARHARAETLFRLRRYAEAARAYGELSPTESRRIQMARAHARAGDVPRGARELETLGNGSQTGQGTRALLLAGLLWEGDDDARAHRLFARVVKRAPGSGAASVSRWQLGWAAYKQGRLEDAAREFSALAAAEKDPVAALRPRYWSIRAADRLGDPDVQERYAELVREYPLSYYGWRARRRTPGDEGSRSLGGVRSGRSALASGELARPRILLEAGLVDEARLELDRMFRRARGIDDRLALAQLYANAGDFNRPQRLVVDAYTERLARGPVPGHVELWWYAWPAPFEEEMRGATLEGMKIRPELVYSIMREESGYRPEVVSVSGARGLLQLMPSTAERVARASQLEPFHVDDLFVPRVNIQLGTDYLAGLLRRFDGNTAAAIGSYNAGPHVVARWIERGSAEEDEWVEEIPYGQTRAYVKRVLRSLHAYQVLY